VLETIRNSGFSMVEICSSPTHLDYRDHQAVQRAGQLMHDLAIEAFSFHAPFREAIDITALDAYQRDKSLKEILIAADSAATMGVRHFVIHPGPDRSGRPPVAEYVARMENAAAVLTRVAKHCRERNMSLVLENMLPHLLFGRTSDVLWIMGAIQDLNVGICLDTGHAHIANDLYASAHKLSGHLQMVHVNDNHGQGDEHLPPGKGSIDWHKLVRQLVANSFRGGCILELAGDPGGRDTVLQKAQEARRYLLQIFQEVDLHNRAAEQA
jgi:sugar phosphate isomerase/epimerase